MTRRKVRFQKELKKKLQETTIPEPSPAKSLKPAEIKKPNETPSAIERRDQKQKVVRPLACDYIYEEGASLYDVCVMYYSDAEKLEAKKQKTIQAETERQKALQEQKRAEEEKAPQEAKHALEQIVNQKINEFNSR